MDEASQFYPLFGLGANVALIFSGRAVKIFSQIRAELPPDVDGWGLSLRGLMGMVVIGGLLIAGVCVCAPACCCRECVAPCCGPLVGVLPWPAVMLLVLAWRSIARQRRHSSSSPVQYMRMYMPLTLDPFLSCPSLALCLSIYRVSPLSCRALLQPPTTG